MIEPVALSTLTTFRVGGPPAARVAPVTEQDLINETLVVWGMDENWMLLGGGSNTVVADAGGRVLVSTAGDSRLATAGTGDVLAGLVGAIIARGVDPFDAAACAAHLHGTAALLGAREGFVAGDLPDLLPEAWAAVRAAAS